MKLVVFSNKHKLSGKLTKFFTGSYAYHVGWADEEAGFLYDMNLLRRRRPWPIDTKSQMSLHDFPQVTREYLEFQLTHDNNVYGVWDYLLFGLRPLFHLVGRSTRNAGGIICSEMVNIDLQNCGVKTPFKVDDEPPSPADLERWLNETGR